VTIKLMHAKLHRVRVTSARRDYVGSITLDQELLDAVGLLPLEEVDIANVTNGQRWSTYVLPGDRGSGDICPNGGGALLCEPGDILIIWAYEHAERRRVLSDGHRARVALVDEENALVQVFEQHLAIDGTSVKLAEHSGASEDGTSDDPSPGRPGA